MSAPKPKFLLKPVKAQQTIDHGGAVAMWETLRRAIKSVQVGQQRINNDARVRVLCKSFRTRAVRLRVRRSHWSPPRFELTQQCELSNLSFEELYRYSYLLVVHKHGELLYEGVHAVVKEHLASRLQRIVARTSNETLLSDVIDLWVDHKRDMGRINAILAFMERGYIEITRKLSLSDLGVVVFRETVVMQSSVRGRIQALLLEAFAAERMTMGGRGSGAAPMDRGVIRNALAMLVDLGLGTPDVYVSEFETGLLEATAAFYGAESREALSTSSAAEYLLYAERRLVEERERAVELLHPTTVRSLMDVVHAQLISAHAVALIEMEGSGLPYVLGQATAAIRSDVLTANRAEYGYLKPMVDLRRMWKLFNLVTEHVVWRPPTGGVERLVPPVVALRESIKARIVTAGRALLADALSAPGGDAPGVAVTLVKALADLRDAYAAIIESAFGDDRDFTRALKEAFETLLNDGGSGGGTGESGDDHAPSAARASRAVLCAEYLSIFVDEHMRNKFRGADEATIDATLNRVIGLFRFLHNKDVFEAYYKDHLQKRLLGGKSANDDAERIMLSKLKTECGFAYTSKLEGMFNDLQMSAEFNRGYKAARAASGSIASAAGAGTALSCVELDAIVLTSGFWPLSAIPLTSVPLSPDVAAAAAAFSTYYQSKHTGRRLTWHFGKGNADVIARFGGSQGGCGVARTYELAVSTYQMCALLLFNTTETQLSYRAIRAALGGDVPETDLKRHLLSLTASKVKILHKSNAKSKMTVEDDETFSVNSDFESKLVRVRVPLISVRAMGDGGDAAGRAEAGEADDVAGQVEDARRQQLEAAIVRIMKTRKTMEHLGLVTEVLKHVSARFRPSTQDIKRRIDGLIERDYLERDEQTHTTYHYLA